MNLFKSIVHNIGVVVVGLGVAFIGTRVDSFFGISDFHSIFATVLAWLLLAKWTGAAHIAAIKAVSRRLVMEGFFMERICFAIV
jgi:hypothetical protein